MAVSKTEPGTPAESRQYQYGWASGNLYEYKATLQSLHRPIAAAAGTVAAASSSAASTHSGSVAGLKTRASGGGRNYTLQANAEMQRLIQRCVHQLMLQQACRLVRSDTDGQTSGGHQK